MTVLVLASLLVGGIAPFVVSQASATAPSQTATLSTGAQSYGMVYDSGVKALYVVDFFNVKVDSIPISTYSPSPITLPYAPQKYNSSISYDPAGYIYIATQTNKIAVVSDSGNTVSSIYSNSAAPPQTMVYDPTNGHTYVCDSGSSSYAQAISSGSNVTTISLGSGGCTATGYSPTTGDVYVYRGGSSGTISVIDTTTNAVSSITGVSSMSPDGFAYDPADGEMYAAGGSTSSTVYVISTSNSVSSITVGSGPYALAYDIAAGNEMAATNQGSGSVSFISSITNTVSATVSVGSTPTIPLYNPASGNLYVSDEGANNVLVLSPWGGYVVDSDAVGAHSFALTYDSTDGLVDVASYHSTSVWELPTPRTLSVGSTPVAMAVSSATDDLYVANSGAGTVSIVAPDNSGVTPLTVGTTPDAVVYDSTNHKIAVANAGSDSVSVVSTSNTVSSTISLASGATPTAMVFDPNHGYVYVANNGTNTVSVLNLAGPSVVATLSVGSAPMAIAYDPYNNWVYVANYVSGTVSVISGATVTATVTVGSLPNALAVSPSATGGYVAVTDSGGNTVSIISGTSVAHTATWSGIDPTAIAWDGGRGLFIILFRSVGEWASVSTGGATFTASKVISGSSTSEPSSLSSDPYSGNAFVTLWGLDEVDVLTPGGTFPYSPFSVGTNPAAATYDPVNGETYVANEASSSISEI